MGAMADPTPAEAPCDIAIHVWVLATADLDLRPYTRLCSPEEERRRSRLMFEADRRSVLAAHGLVRLALSWCEPRVGPSAWDFRSGRYGRPEVAAPAQGLDLKTNISRTREWVACVVTRGIDCGIDLESVDRVHDPAGLAGRTLTVGERQELHALPPDQRRRRFIEFWTLKEAFAKALGLGLHLPFDRVEFSVLPTGIRLVSAAPAGPDGDDSQWLFEQWPVGGSHVAALAVRRPAQPVRIVRHSTPPPLDGVEGSAGGNHADRSRAAGDATGR